ncbi:MAG: shikimate dehydrogenase, partial [Acetobacteraceae bacterium]|nr:shikimate dehydrogenase [Acetobacteraceae bacterium]
GLIGYGIQGSLTPAMHMREGEEEGLRLLYQKIDLQQLGLGAEALPDLLTAAERMGFAGLNITFPVKQSIIPLLTELSDNARALGAVNTVVLRDGRRSGHNTDLFGYAENLRRGLPEARRERVVQMGAGGAGSAVAEALMQLGVRELTVFDTDAARAEHVASDLVSRHGAGRARPGRDLASALAEADGLVNTTPVGMAKLPGSPVPAELLRPELWVSEIIYFPIETELLKRARTLGCRTLDGGGMAVFQAVRAFELFTGIKPDAERMRRHFNELQAAAAGT